MRSEAAGFFKARNGEEPLVIEIFNESEGHILEGVLRESDGYLYPVIDGVPCFLRGAMRPDFEDFRHRRGLQVEQESELSKDVQLDRHRTRETFSHKWRKFQSYGFEPAHQAFLFDWYCKKLGLKDLEALKDFYSTKEMILEIGPGSGFNSCFMAESSSGRVFAADISQAAFVTFDNTRHLPNCHVIQADLMDLPFAEEMFDFIIADGVLHHTQDTKRAVLELYEKVKPGGMFFFYVYRKMGPARVFCDEHIRERFSELEPEECYQACEGLTELGRELSKTNIKITLEKPIPLLGIPAGTHDVQRLVYYNFVKCFWNDAFDFETNNMVNFDWYHPKYAWQHTDDEVKSWLKELGVIDYSFQPANPNGISVLLHKPI